MDVQGDDMHHTIYADCMFNTVTCLQRVRSQGCQAIHLTSTLPHTVISSLLTLVNQVLFTLMVCAFLLGMNISYSTSTSLLQEE